MCPLNLTDSTLAMPAIPRALACLLMTSLIGLIACPAAAQEVPTENLLLRLEADALQSADPPPAITALDTNLDRPTPYTVAAIHPHNGRWSVTISQGTLGEGAAPSRFLSDQTAEFFFYDRVLDEQERNALRGYTARNYNGSDSADSDGLNPGIHVQGNWSVEVREQDGTFVKRKSFENALASTGDGLLSSLVASDSTAGVIRVFVDGDSPPCTLLSDGEGDPVHCELIEVGQPLNASPQFATLTKNVPDSGENEDKLVLQGDFTAQRDGAAGTIEALLYLCEPDVNPVSCEPPTGDLINFTSKTLGTPVDVSTNQQVNVEVVISFN